KGALYTNATSGSSPSNTPPIHATIGTGAFPSRSGIADDYARIAGGIQKPYELGPGVLMEPTLADLYDRDMGNRPVVGAVATLDAHLGMLGHGSLWGGGDKDIAVTRELTNAGTAGAEGFKWDLSPAMAPYYRFPSYVNDVPGFQSDLQKLDLLDGQDDNKWRNNPIDQMHQGFDTPARTPYQTRIIEQVISREGFGKDSVPDLLYLNYKAIDTIGHLFSLNSLEMKDAVSYQDVALRQLVDFLNRVVGQNRWVMALTADHGHQYDPAVSGAFLIGIDQLQADIEKRFDTDGDGVPVVQKMRTTQLWVNQAELAQNGYTLDQVAQYISQLTEADTVKPTETIQPGHAGDRVFEAAFPTTLMPHLPCLQGDSPG
ncbi:MAG TPA: alkaline phosphatase family protein, partial [Actinomycetota bacterium]